METFTSGSEGREARRRVLSYPAKANGSAAVFNLPAAWCQNSRRNKDGILPDCVSLERNMVSPLCSLDWREVGPQGTVNSAEDKGVWRKRMPSCNGLDRVMPTPKGGQLPDGSWRNIKAKELNFCER